MTTAPPDMSVFIGTIASRGFSDRPPVSYVMPLPTSTTRGVSASKSGGVYVSSISRGGRVEPMPTATIPPNPSAASTFSSRTDTRSRALSATARARCASHSGSLTLDGVCTRSRASQPAPATARPRSTAADRSVPVPASTSVLSGALGPSALRSA